MSAQLQLETGSLLSEILGFHPQLFLDNVINIANEQIDLCTEEVATLMSEWTQERAKSGTSNLQQQEDLATEVEEGLVAFQTLLESHVDLAFDFFEVWTLRNIFFISPDLRVTVPHQRGLNLQQDPNAEAELFEEIIELRKQLRNKRRLTRLLKSAIPVSNAQLARARARFDSISFLPSEPPSSFLVDTLTELANSLPEPTFSDSSIPSPSQQLQDPTKRPWERGRTGYDQWAVSRLIERANGDDHVYSNVEIENTQREVFGEAEELWTIHGALEAEKASRPRDFELANVESEPKKRRL